METNLGPSLDLELDRGFVLVPCLKPGRGRGLKIGVGPGRMVIVFKEQYGTSQLL